jgi:hypothetical protein
LREDYILTHCKGKKKPDRFSKPVRFDVCDFGKKFFQKIGFLNSFSKSVNVGCGERTVFGGRPYYDEAMRF